MKYRQLITALALGLTAFALTNPVNARINQRQAHQQKRIAQGISNGSLTAKEAERLEHQQAHIAKYEAKSRADDGGLDAHERARLENMQDRASHNIRRQKHDNQKR